MQSEAAQSLLSGLPLPVLLIGPSERIMHTNGHARDLLGDAIEGRHFITAIRQPSVLDAVEQTMTGAATATTRYIASRDGQDTTYEVTTAPVTLNGDKAVLVSFRDITQQERAGHMRRDFVANVSHELRTPLTALLGFIETLRGPARDDAAARERFLGIMEGEAARMNRLVGDLLSLSRVEADERLRPTTPVNLSSVIRSTVHRLTPVADAAGARLIVDVPDADVRLPGDEDQLGQVVGNLIENAIKYGGTGVEVRVTLDPPTFQPRLRGPGVVLTVQDTGPGIDQVHLPRLTERFYRVDSHRSREVGGTGLGLAIVKHIIGRHRGRLSIDSTLGEGAKFSIILGV